MRGEKYATELNTLVYVLRKALEQSSLNTDVPKAPIPVSPAAGSGSQLSVLHLIRQHAFGYSVRAFQILLDDKKVGVIHNKESCALEVQAGHHTISLHVDWHTTTPLTFDIVPGENVTFLCQAQLLSPFIKLWRQ